jgi:hypothetical protein
MCKKDRTMQRWKEYGASLFNAASGNMQHTTRQVLRGAVVNLHNRCISASPPPGRGTMREVALAATAEMGAEMRSSGPTKCAWREAVLQAWNRISACATALRQCPGLVGRKRNCRDASTRPINYHDEQGGAAAVALPYAMQASTHFC